ncbi:zinc finger protein 277 isoform X3 [Hemicordylus capensis]|uniref:zinc finger protein 277 isoform X3 n=1 Tax=Hemicordylus capensis TaxID=884348 RepID=UPI002303C7A0|nr:zinc finger protein 277 isoform X3 [Hemicordylus capensis]
MVKRKLKGEIRIVTSLQNAWSLLRTTIQEAQLDCIPIRRKGTTKSRRMPARLTDHRDYILEPLSLPESPGGVSAVEGSPSVPCIFCEEYSPSSEQNQLFKHMIIEHKLVIADVKLVADFRRYALYWKKRFTEQPITDFCCVIRTNSEASLEEQDNYFLLCDALPEDRILREKLQQQRLREILEQQQQERDDTDFNGTCMFCDKELTGNRSVLLNHMANDHAFNVGLPDNIVNCKGFLEVVQKKLDSLQCLYCEKIFRDKNTLKDHMRKKQHRRINAKNREYDRFYIINYLHFHSLNCNDFLLRAILADVCCYTISLTNCNSFEKPLIRNLANHGKRYSQKMIENETGLTGKNNILFVLSASFVRTRQTPQKNSMLTWRRVMDLTC